MKKRKQTSWKRGEQSGCKDVKERSKDHSPSLSSLERKKCSPKSTGPSDGQRAAFFFRCCLCTFSSSFCRSQRERDKLTFPPSGPSPSEAPLVRSLHRAMEVLPPPDGGAADDGRPREGEGDGNEEADISPTATTTTTTSTQHAPLVPPPATLKLRNDRGHVELSDNGFCKVSLWKRGT